MSATSVTDCDGTVIPVSLSDEISSAITSWAGVAEQYESRTETTLAILGQYFLTRNQFLSYDSEVKYYISKGLPERDRIILSESSIFLNERNKTSEKKRLADARTQIKKKILKIFNRLLIELFPSFLNPRVDPTRAEPTRPDPTRAARTRLERTSIESTDNDTIPSPANNETDDEITTACDEADDPADEELLSNLNMGGLTISEPRVNLNPQFNRARYGNATASLPQGIFVYNSQIPIFFLCNTTPYHI